MSEDKLNHARCSIDDGWKELERSGEISNSAENILNSASWLIGEVEKLEAGKAELLDALSNVQVQYVCGDDDFASIEKLLQKHKGDSDV